MGACRKLPPGLSGFHLQPSTTNPYPNVAVRQWRWLTTVHCNADVLDWDTSGVNGLAVWQWRWWTAVHYWTYCVSVVKLQWTSSERECRRCYAITSADPVSTQPDPDSSSCTPDVRQWPACCWQTWSSVRGWPGMSWRLFIYLWPSGVLCTRSETVELFA